MHIVQVVIQNFGPYRDKRVLDLEPEAYAVVGRFENDPDRSNTAGKTSLLEAIRFALHGVHRERMEDGWITNGEKAGFVSLVFDDGTVIYRSRMRGKATKLEFGQYEGFDTCQSWTQESAQAEIDKRLGLSCDDFSTCHVAQGQAASFVTSDPSARTAMVSSWLRLERLEACEANVRRRVANLALARTKLEAALGGAKARVERAMGEAKDLEQLDVEHQALQERLQAARKAREAAHGALARGAEVARLRGAKERYEAIVGEGVALKQETACLEQGLVDLAGLERESKASDGVLLRSMQRVEEKKRLASGGFDGKCPVAGIDCPATAQIRSMKVELQKAYETEAKVEEVVRAEDRKINDRLKRERAKAQEFSAKSMRLSFLREQAKKLKAEADAFVATGPVEQVEAPTDVEVDGLAMQAAKLEQRWRDASEGIAEHQNLMSQLRDFDEYMTTHQEALAIFGRQGARKRVATSALGEIEELANDMLSEAGLDLEVALEWERAGKGPATECPVCGWAYPASTKVKECGQCGAPRGPKMVQALEVVRSKVSGAADDWAGVALSLAAASWLRAERGAQWGVFMLDEVLAQTDKANRRAMSAHLPAMLRLAGGRQSFVIAHDEQVSSAFPRKIVVVSDGAHARLSVE